MPRLFFDVCEESARFLDEDGTEMADFETAEQEALRAALEMAANSRKGGSIKVQVRNESNQVVAVARASASVLRLVPND